MGNCQAAEAATVVIQRPGGMVQRIYWSVSANEIMASNPGHYVAVVTASVTPRSETGVPVKHLKLLRPDDTLHIGHVYRLISFEQVLKEFAGKKYTKLSRVELMQKQQRGEKEGGGPRTPRAGESTKVVEQEQEKVSRVGSSGRVGVSRHQSRQWKPALQSIAEVGS